jgi:uncharacterized membrane protein
MLGVMLTAFLTPTLLAATVATGLTAGFLAAFAHTVMPGLAATDDRTFVAAFQAADRAVTNPWFLVPFTLGPLLIGAALLLALGDQQRGVAMLLGAALVLAAATVVITGTVHLPLNRELQEVALGADLADARARFEHRWVQWNVVRSVTSTGAFVTLALALLRVR